MSESGDYNPGPWSGHDFSSARKVYDRHVGRSYDDARRGGKKAEDLLVPNLSTDSSAPLIIVCDVTGSMGEWPAVMFSKLPYLEIEGKEYLGESMEIAFSAVGDAYVDNYPLQVRPFAKGLELETRLKELVIEGGGGGQVTESYELAALYFARKVEMPKAVKPVIVFIGDEAAYGYIDRDQAKQYLDIDLEKRLTTKDVFEELKNKFSVYLVRKPYETSSRNAMSSVDQGIYAQWEELLGAERIAHLPDASRVVDVIFGLLANETGRVEYFREELEGRQKPEQIETVYKSLKTIHRLPAKAGSSGKSVMKGLDDGTDAKPLI